MAEGPGRYDRYCTLIRKETGAHTVIVLVLDGNEGSGFSVQSTMIDSREKLPDLLEDMANDIKAGRDE